MIRAVLALATAATLAGGCAKKSDQIAATYVSPYQYENYSCPQLADEAQRISVRASMAAGAQDEKATKDTVATTVGAIVFWPALFFIGGTISRPRNWPACAARWKPLSKPRCASAATFSSSKGRISRGIFMKAHSTRSMFSEVVSRELGPLSSPVPSESVQVGGQKVELDR